MKAPTARKSKDRLDDLSSSFLDLLERIRKIVSKEDDQRPARSNFTFSRKAALQPAIRKFTVSSDRNP